VTSNLRADIHPATISVLKTSEIYNFTSTNPRAGLFVDYKWWTFHRLIKICVNRNIPIWVHWGRVQDWVFYISIIDHLPTYSEIAAACAATIQQVNTEEVAELEPHDTSRDGDVEINCIDSPFPDCVPPVPDLPATLTASTPLPPLLEPPCNPDNFAHGLKTITFVGGLLELLYQRYGFLNPGGGNGVMYHSTFNWDTAKCILGLASQSQLVQDMVTGDSLHSSYIRSAICHFVECTITTLHNMSAELFDLHQSSYKPFKPSTHLRIFKRELQFKNENRPMHVYLIKQVASTDSWTVMLCDPATVLECCCQFETLVEIVAFLFLNSRPFNVLVVEQCTPPPHLCMYIPH
jgi:hypothetical protein